MIVAIHQPNFLPWMGYFYKMAKCDVFVLLDNVQYAKNGFINRNKIKTPQGENWLTVPVTVKFGDLINEVKINNRVDWRKKHLRTLEMNYKKTEFFGDIFSRFKEIYHLYDWLKLSEFNVELIKFVASYLGLNKKIIKASDSDAGGKSTELLVEIVKKAAGSIYLSGFGGEKYQEEKLFEKAGIILEYYSFRHPLYRQLWKDFIPNLSIIDLLFNYGKKSTEVMLNE